MSDFTKDYSLYDTHMDESGNSSPHKLASPPKPAPRTLPRFMTHKLKEREGKLPTRYIEDELSNQQQLLVAYHAYSSSSFQSKLNQPSQQNNHLRPTNTLTDPQQQYKPCQSVKPCTSVEPRRDYPHRFGESYHPLPLPLSQPDPKDQERFMEKVVAKLQALKNDSASNGSKYNNFDMPSCQAERGHAVLDNHFNNHFTINHKLSRNLKRNRNEPTKRTNPVKAYCTYVEFDGSKKTEITSYLLKPKSNTLLDLKRELPSHSEGSKLFFKNQDNILEQADYDEQQLHTFRYKDGSDIIMCEIVVPKTVVPRWD